MNMEKYVIVIVTSRDGAVLGSFKAEMQELDTDPDVYREIEDLVEFHFDIESIPKT
jgi:hypothetical protein